MTTITPTLLLAPGTSRTAAGPISPVVASGVTIVPGQYGDAWYFPAAADRVYVPSAATYLPVAAATVLVHVRFGASAGPRYPIGANLTQFSIGRSEGGTALGHLGGTLATGAADTIPLDQTVTLAHRYSAAGAQVLVNGVVSAAQPYKVPNYGTGVFTIADGNMTGANHTYSVESVLVYPLALTDAEIAGLSSLDAAWTWENATLQRPDAITMPILRIGSPHIAPLRVGKD